ncbi:Extracellular metalloproteinase mep [Cladobotryum mycophilum]|uniref:Extracellular metalloproteinase n=1 Tax=Cladobotryum mycophilum TaxID=491253 RepID=A0ABR0SXQ7_9HYPO
MKSLSLLALAGLAANVQAHPQKRHEPGSTLSKRGVDISKFRLPEVAHYTVSDHVEKGPPSFAPQDYVQTATDLVKKVAPDSEFRVIDDHYVDVDGIGHVHFKQTAHGIDIDNADFKVNIGRDGTVFSFGNGFYAGKIPDASPLHKRDFSDPVAGLHGAVQLLGLPVDTKGATAVPVDQSKEDYTFKGTSGAQKDPQARLVYLTKADGSLSLTWRVETDTLDNWLQTYVDAKSGEEIHGVVDWVNDLATLEVYPWGVNDPTEGDRVTIKDPWRADASPLNWFNDGSKKYTTTRGNNAIAQVNPSGGNTYLNNYRPDAGASLNFVYPYNTSISDPKSYQDASITQLYYTGNKYHDLLYVLGFNEAAGNFQNDNQGKGGKGADYVILNSQDGSGTNNANFATPPDGQNGRMRMYLWTASKPQRDCAFEAGVVLHEFTHGLSNRLTGGPANSNCLNALESGGMGEGWSDFYATAIRLKKDDTHSTDYPMGAWVDNNPKGIRQYPYSTSLTTNPLTYKSLNTQNEVHAIGTTWATVLYELLWNLIDKHGKNDADFPTLDSKGVPTDGKFLSMKLVMAGMSLQPCNPTMVSARDAIIDADKSLTGGSNVCEIWKAFAKRGLGQNAKYSSSSRTEDFTVPSGVCK